MAKSRQSFPNITSRFLSSLDDSTVPEQPTAEVHHEDRKTIAGQFRFIPYVTKIGKCHALFKSPTCCFCYQVKLRDRILREDDKAFVQNRRDSNLRRKDRNTMQFTAAVLQSTRDRLAEVADGLELQKASVVGSDPNSTFSSQESIDETFGISAPTPSEADFQSPSSTKPPFYSGRGASGI